MTAEQLVEKIMKRHKNAEDGVLQDIAYVAKKQTFETIDQLWEYYLSKWQAAYCPRPSFFIQFLQGQSKYDSGTMFQGAWICKDCDCRYAPLEADFCPKCGSREISAIGDQAHPKFVWVNLPKDTHQIEYEPGQVWLEVLSRTKGEK